MPGVPLNRGLIFLRMFQALPNLYSNSFFGDRWAVDKCSSIDLNVLVHYLEQLALQLISQCRCGLSEPLHNLLLPRSWASIILNMWMRGPQSPSHFDLVLLLNPAASLLCAINNWNGDGKYHFP